ncbi:MAG: hypothetical protein V4667_07330 [Bacteroidota bacterium]
MKKIFYLLIIVLCFVKNTEAQTELNSTGTGAAYALSYPAAFTYSSGITITFKAHTVNTGAATLNVNGLGTKDVFKNVSSSLAFGDIAAGQFVTVIYDGTNFQLTTPVSSSSSPSWALAGNTGTTAGTNFIGTTDAVDFVAKTNNVERLRILSGGNVGIGTGSPAPGAQLHVVGAAKAAVLEGSYSSTLITSSIITEIVNNDVTNNNYSLIGFSDQGTSGTPSVKIGSQTIDHTNDYGDFVVGTRSAVGFTEKMRVTSAGNIGVGISSPVSLFTINNATNSQLRLSTTALGNTSADGMLIDLNGTSGSINLYENLPLSFATNSTTKMTILAAGNVGIGTTGPSSLLSVGASSQFQVSATGDILRIKNLAYTWPSTAVAGALQNDGTGNLTWGAVAGTLSGGTANKVTYWTGTNTVSANSLFSWDNTNARLGVGIAAPLSTLHLANASIPTFNMQSTSTLTTAASTIARINFHDSQTAASGQASIYSIRDGASAGVTDLPTAIAFSTTPDGASSPVEAMRINNQGFIGIGSTYPQQIFNPLSIRSTDVTTNGSSGTFIDIHNTANANNTFAGFRFRATANSVPYDDEAFQAGIFFNRTDGLNFGRGDIIIASKGTADYNNVNALTDAKMVIKSGGQVGIGVLSPIHALDIDGTINLRPTNGRIALNGNFGLPGYVLVSNGAGSANSWADPAALGTNYWAKTGASVYPTSITNNVAIGALSAIAKLDVRDISVTTTGTLPGNLHVMSTNPQAIDIGGSISIGGYYDDAATGARMFATIEARKSNSTTANAAGYLLFKTNSGASTIERMRIDAGGNVGIGTSSPGATRLNLTIPNTDATNPIGLTINNNYIGSSDKFGIDVNVDGAGSGQKFGISSSVVGLAADASAIYGYQVAMTPNGTGIAHGVYSVLSAVGTGTRYGFYNSVAAEATSVSTIYGIRNILSGAAATKYGMYTSGEDRNYFSGNVGIGITNPSSKLEVVGDVEIPATNDYKYSTPKTYYYTISPGEFTSNSEINYSMGRVVDATTGSVTYAYFANGVATSQGYATAGVHLPDGAKITKFSAWLYNNDLSVTNIPTVYLLRRTLTSGTYGIIASCSLATVSTAITRVDDNAPANIIVDNLSYPYVVTFLADQASSTLRLYTVQIEYTVDNAQ